MEARHVTGRRVLLTGALAGAAALVAAAVPAHTPTAEGPFAESAGGRAPAADGLAGPAKKEIAMRLVSSAENSSLNWRAQYGYIEDIRDGRGYTAGIIGFCTGTGDLLRVVEDWTAREPDNPLVRFLPALRAVNGTASHAGLDPGFTAAWKAAAGHPAFRRAQDRMRDRAYFGPAVRQGKADGLRALGQFIYYDAVVVHGPGSDAASFGGIRAAAMRHAAPPSRGGDEAEYLEAFLAARRAAMRAEPAHRDTSRVDDAQQVFLDAGNFALDPPLRWRVYGDLYTIPAGLPSG